MAFRTNKMPVLQTKSASGSVASFNTALAMPLKSCVVNFNDQTGIDSLDFSATGKNLFNIDRGENGYINDSGMVVSSAAQWCSDYIRVKSMESYTISANQPIYNIGIAYFDDNKNIVLPRYDNPIVSLLTINIPNNIKYLRFWMNIVTTATADIIRTYNPQIEKGSTATAFEPFGDIKLFSFGKTIQSGSLNVLTGELTNNDTTPPEVINLGGMEIDTLQGVNNIFADTGDVDLTYKDLDIAKRGNFREVFKLPS